MPPPEVADGRDFRLAEEISVFLAAKYLRAKCSQICP